MILAGARVLVTGGVGFIGSNLARRLVADGAGAGAEQEEDAEAARAQQQQQQQQQEAQAAAAIAEEDAATVAPETGVRWP